MKKRIIIVLVLFIILKTSYAQYNNSNIWYFGEYAGVDFNVSPPEARTDGKLDTWEGCSSICNQAGDILFYTDGTYVYNRNHSIMLNGSGLMGNYSSSQSAIIVPKPGASADNTLYYIFTTDSWEHNLENGLRYSVVDMSLDGGLGDITSEKNILVTAKVAEKVAAIRHSNGVDVWVVAHQWGNNDYLAFRLTPEGLETTPVISSIGISYTGSYTNAGGQLHFSEKGNYAASSSNYIHHLELLKFDPATGVFSNLIWYQDFDLFRRVWGVEFSRNGKFLYFSRRPPNILCQLNLQDWDSLSVLSSLTVIDSTDGSPDEYDAGTLQMAPDDKIYLTRYDRTFLSVIEQPDLEGSACGFKEIGVDLKGRKCKWGLPNLFRSSLEIDFTFNPLCYGDTTMFYSQISQSDSVQWNFDDPASGIENHSTALNPGHVFTSTGTFDVVLTVWIGGTSKTLTKQVAISETVPVNLGSDTTFCNGNSLLLSPSSNYFHYLWQDGSTDSLYVADASGTYWVQVTDSSGCKATDSITIDTFPGFDFSIGNDTTICFGDYVFLYAPPGFESYQWQDGSDNTSYIADTSGYYWLQVTDTNNCVIRDSMLLTANKIPNNILGNDTLFCKDGTFTLQTNPVYEQYFWSNGSNDSVLTTSQPGKYWVTVFDTLGCSGSDTIQLDYFPAITLDLDAIGQLCEDDSVILQAVSNYNNYLWQDSSQNQTYIAKDSGIYWVKVTTPCETKSDSITIDACSSIWVPNVFTPNNDGYNDYFGAVAKNIIKFKLVIFNRWGQELKTLHNIDEKWDGTYRGHKAAQGTYFWVADYEQVERDGSTKHVRLQGSVTLLR